MQYKYIKNIQIYLSIEFKFASKSSLSGFFRFSLSITFGQPETAQKVCDLRVNADCHFTNEAHFGQADLNSKFWTPMAIQEGARVHVPSFAKTWFQSTFQILRIALKKTNFLFEVYFVLMQKKKVQYFPNFEIQNEFPRRFLQISN